MPRYSFGSTIGEGGFGYVQQAIRTEDEWECAAKFLSFDHTDDELRRFQREIRIQLELCDGKVDSRRVSQFIDDTHIVPIVAMNTKVTPPWFIMPRAHRNARDYLDDHYGEEHLWIFTHAALGVAYAHERGVLHRDLHPGNILIFAHGDCPTAAVCDFGIGRFMKRDSPTITNSDGRFGTFVYSAPEQWVNGKKADQRSDVFSLGKVLYEVLTGKTPYPVELSNVPTRLASVVERATDFDERNRFNSVATMLNALESSL